MVCKECQRHGILRRHNLAGVPNQFRKVSHIRGRTWNRAGHGLPNDVRKAFPGGGDRGHVQGCRDAGDVAAFSQQVNSTPEIGPLDKRDQILVFPSRPTPAQQEVDLANAGRHPSGGAEKCAMVLLRIHAGHQSHQQRIGRDPELLADRPRGIRIRSKLARVDAVGDDDAFARIVSEAEPFWFILSIRATLPLGGACSPETGHCNQNGELFVTVWCPKQEERLRWCYSGPGLRECGWRRCY